MENVLEINGLSKHYGRIKAVDQLNLTIPKGKVFGILGPNGSGKTTTLGMILDVINPTTGSFSWFGKGNSHQLRKRIGAILETPIFYPYMSGYDNLRVVCKIKEVQNAEERIAKVLKVVNLEERAIDKFTTYSLGMKQRLAIASALLADPEVLIFDEPTNGLDPQGIADMRELIIRIGNTGKTIILASHLLDEVQKVCSHFAVLKKGKLIYEGIVADVKSEQKIVELSADDMDLLHKALSKIQGVSEFRTEGPRIVATLQDALSLTQLNEALFKENITLSHLALRAKNLEQQFLEILSQSK